MEWYDVLWELERAPEGARRPVELEGRLLLAQYNLSRLVDRLAQAGYLTKHRCDKDGRGQVLVLTEAGKALRQRMWGIYSAAIERYVGSRLRACLSAPGCAPVRLIPSDLLVTTGVRLARRGEEKDVDQGASGAA